MAKAKKSVDKKPAKEGRPTKYSPAVAKKVVEYVDSCVDEVYDYHKTQGMTSNTFERKLNVKIPTLEGLATYLNVHRDTLQEWKKLHPEFSVSFDYLLRTQAERLMMGGLSGDYNPTIAKLILSANHGMKERVDNTTDDKPLPPNVTVNNINTLSNEELIKLAAGGAGGAST